MALIWQIPYQEVENDILIKALDIKTIYTSKEEVEIDLTKQLNDKKIKVKWTELDEENQVLLVPDDNKVLDLILNIEPIERNPKKKSFDGKIIKPDANEVLNYGY